MREYPELRASGFRCIYAGGVPVSRGRRLLRATRIAVLVACFIILAVFVWVTPSDDIAHPTIYQPMEVGQ